jgi:hypothetical protein
MAKHICNLITYRRYMVGEIWQHHTYFSLELTRNGELYDYDIQDLNLKVLRFRSLYNLTKYSKYIIGKDVKIDHSI